MKRKNEVQLIELAFGDVNPEEATQLRQQVEADASSMATLQAYEELRNSLGNLRDVPEMQMSRERLRDAILADGLRESRRFTWTWFAAPAAVAALAFAFTLLVRDPVMPLPGGGGIATLDAGSLTMNMDPTIERPNRSVAALLGNEELGRIKFPEPDKTTIETSAQGSTVAKFSKRATPLASKATEPEPAPPVATVASASAPVVADAASMGAAKPEEVEAEVIVFTLDTDVDTGARRATAMESSSNVVIGG